MVALGRVLLVMMMITIIFAIFSHTVSANMHQDFCVADYASGVRMNGYACRENVNADDFFFAGLAKPGLTNNTMGTVAAGANAQKIPGLNTLGVSMSRVDYAPGALNPPHTHPRASEISFVVEGELDVGFITTANVLISKHIKQGEVFVFPRGLVHFAKNTGRGPAVVISGFNSQLPGTQSIGATLFAASPAVPEDVLAKAFQFGTKDVKNIHAKLAPKK